RRAERVGGRVEVDQVHVHGRVEGDLAAEEPEEAAGVGGRGRVVVVQHAVAVEVQEDGPAGQGGPVLVGDGARDDRVVLDDLLGADEVGGDRRVRAVVDDGVEVILRR